MNGSAALNEQLIGKFHVEKLPNNILINADESNITSTTISTDEQTCPSRFQMIRVDRNFGRERWKVHDYETPENATNLPSSSVTNADNESNSTKSLSALVNSDSTNVLTTSVPNGFPPKTAQPRLSISTTPLILPPGNIPSPAGLLHAYSAAPPAPAPPPPGALPNLTASTQSYLLTHHHHHPHPHPHPQFGYFPFFVPPYSPYAAQWAAIAAANPYLPPPPIISATPSTTINDPITEITNDNSVVTSTTEHLNNPPPIATTPFLYAPHHSHSPYVPQHVAAVTSPYATIPSYHPVATLPTIVPPTNPNLSTSSNETTSSQQAPLLSSPKQDSNKTNLIQHPALIITPQTTNSSGPSATNNTQITDLISASPLLTSTEQAAPISLISPVTTSTSTSQENLNQPNTTTSFPDIWSYTNGGSPLNLTQTAAAAICLLNHENNSNPEITNEILKELTTPTKQNHTTDIDNKISAAMDLVKMHLLSAVREEVTELREQIRTLQEKITSIEQENTFLRQHVSNEIYAQYIPFVSISDSSQSIGAL